MTIRIKREDALRRREERVARSIRNEQYALSLETRSPTLNESYYQKQGVSL